MNRQGIEGVPDHLRVVGYRAVIAKEYYMNDLGEIHKRVSTSTAAYLIVEPDNVYGVYDLAEVKIPAGYEFVEFREPVERENCMSYPTGEFVLDISSAYRSNREDKRRIIVKPIAKKTRRVLVVDATELPEQFNLENVVAIGWRASQVDLNLKWRIEEREVA